MKPRVKILYMYVCILVMNVNCQDIMIRYIHHLCPEGYPIHNLSICSNIQIIPILTKKWNFAVHSASSYSWKKTLCIEKNRLNSSLVAAKNIFNEELSFFCLLTLQSHYRNFISKKFKYYS